MRYLACLVLCFLSSACSTIMPTSAKLEQVRADRMEPLTQDTFVHNLVPGAPVYIRIFKEENVLELWMKGEEQSTYALYKTWPICAFSGELGPKLAEGDKQAPEGFYTVAAEQLNPWSTKHLSFNLGFPNAYDQANGRTGSLLMIHGGCDSVGCFAMTDPVIEDIYLLVEASLEKNDAPVPVHVFPFRMNEENLMRHAGSEWQDFWLNLKEGYDIFESHRIPPVTLHQNRRYVFIRPMGGISS